MKKQFISISEERVIQALNKFIAEADADELARITGEVFGGKCYNVSDDTYHFIPDENYAGEFNTTKKAKIIQK